jgi:hypothetical protein
MRSSLCVVAASLAALTCLTAKAADDISGVTLGSSLADAKEAIVKANPDFKLTPLMLRSGNEGGVTAVTPDLVPEAGVGSVERPAEEFAVLQTEAGKVWFIARVQRLEQGARIKTDTLEASLTEKFGKPSSPGTSYGYVWQFDREAKQYFGPEHQGPCESMMRGVSNLPGVTVGAPESFSPTCGKLITVSTSAQPDGMVPYYKIFLIDVKTMFDELAERDAQAEADRLKKLSDEQAKGVKPKL